MCVYCTTVLNLCTGTNHTFTINHSYIHTFIHSTMVHIHSTYIHVVNRRCVCTTHTTTLHTCARELATCSVPVNHQPVNHQVGTIPHTSFFPASHALQHKIFHHKDNADKKYQPQPHLDHRHG